MTFLNPFILLGLLAAAIPILIHLFNFRKPKKVDFSSLAFLRELEKTAMQRVKIEQWLLLALRIAAICFLVLGFAQPILQGNATDAKHAKTLFTLVLDNSLSMKLRDTRGEYLQQAKQVITQVANQAKKGDEFLLQTTAPTGLPPKTVFKNTVSLLEEVQKMRPETGARSLVKTVKSAFLQLEDISNRNKEIYILTDLQRSTFIDSLEAVKPKDVRLILVPIGNDSPTNVAVTDIQVESRIIEQGQPVEMSATLTNYSDKRLENFSANVFLENKPVAQALANLEPKGQAKVKFTITPQQRGWLGGYLKIDSDPFEDDNTRYFTVLVPEKRSVLVVRGDGERANFVELALSPQLTGGRVLFQVNAINEGALASTALENYNAVLLVGVKTLSSGEIANLKRYIEAGGGVLFSPGNTSALQDYTQFFNSLGGGKANGYLGQVGSGNAIGKFDRVETEHPLFEGMFAQGDLATGKQIETVDVRYQLNYGAGTGDEQTLIRLTNNAPFLHEIRTGKGAMLLLTVAPDPTWGDLPSRGLFIPLMYRSVYYLSSSRGQNEGQLGTEKEGEILVTGTQGAAAIKLYGQDGEEFSPAQHAAYNGVVISIDEAIAKSGLYEVRQGETVLRKVAVNADSRESDLTRLSTEEAKQALKQATQTDVSLIDIGNGTERQIKEAIGEERFGMELWNVFLFIALLALIAEMLVSIQRRRQPATS